MLTATPSFTAHLELSIEGMHCSSCVKRVENALSAVLGVRKAEVNLARKRASISYDPQVTQPAGLADAVKQLGYPAHPTSD